MKGIQHKKSHVKSNMPIIKSDYPAGSGEAQCTSEMGRDDLLLRPEFVRNAEKQLDSHSEINFL